MCRQDLGTLWRDIEERCACVRILELSVCVDINAFGRFQLVWSNVFNRSVIINKDCDILSNRFPLISGSDWGVARDEKYYHLLTAFGDVAGDIRHSLTEGTGTTCPPPTTSVTAFRH